MTETNFSQIEVREESIVRIQGNPPVCYLIAMPEGSEYEGLNFWHPAKCTFKKKAGGYKLSFRKDEWKFKLYSQSKSDAAKFECRVILDADTMIACWQNSNN